jgi:hypothetical protein
MGDERFTEMLPVRPTEVTSATPPTRQNFWDETVERILEDFDKFWKRDDSANALACFDELAVHRHAALKTLSDFDASRKSIVSIFQPKSGGTFLHNRMLQLGYKEFWWLFPWRLCHATCYASVEALSLYLFGGCTCHTHARPHPNILAALDRAKVDKIWVHLRNPAASVVSAYHHYRGEGHGDGAIGDERRREAAAVAATFGMGTEIDKNQFAVTHIDWFVEWAASWMQRAKIRPDKVVFSYHRELENPQLLLARVFHEFGVDLHDTVSAAPFPHDRFRQKDSDDWRDGLSRSTQVLVQHRVWSKLADFPDFEQLWT